MSNGLQMSCKAIKLQMLDKCDGPELPSQADLAAEKHAAKAAKDAETIKKIEGMVLAAGGHNAKEDEIGVTLYHETPCPLSLHLETPAILLAGGQDGSGQDISGVQQVNTREPLPKPFAFVDIANSKIGNAYIPASPRPVGKYAFKVENKMSCPGKWEAVVRDRGVVSVAFGTFVGGGLDPKFQMITTAYVGRIDGLVMKSRRRLLGESFLEMGTGGIITPSAASYKKAEAGPGLVPGLTAPQTEEEKLAEAAALAAKKDEIPPPREPLVAMPGEEHRKETKTKYEKLYVQSPGFNASKLPVATDGFSRVDKNVAECVADKRRCCHKLTPLSVPCSLLHLTLHCVLLLARRTFSENLMSAKH